MSAVTKGTEILHENEVKFIDEYVKNGHNASQAYKSVFPSVTDGSAGVGGHRWLKRPHIASALLKKRVEVVTMLDIDRDEQVYHLKKIITDCTSEKSSKSDLRYALQALDMLNKMGGQYIHRVDVTTHVEQPLFGTTDYIIIEPQRDALQEDNYLDESDPF